MNISWMPNFVKKKLIGKGAGDLVKESITIVVVELNNAVVAKSDNNS